MSGIGRPTDTTPQYQEVESVENRDTLTFTVKYKTGPSQGQTIGTFTVQYTLTRIGNSVTINISPFYIGPSIPNGASGLVATLPTDQDITISADGQIPWDFVPKYQTLLTLFISDLMFYSTSSSPVATTSLSKGGFVIPASSNGLVTSIALFSNNNDVAPYIKQSGSSYFSCPYGIISSWYID